MTTKELSEYLAGLGFPCRIDGDAGLQVASVATLEDAGPDQLSFLANPKYQSMLATTAAGAVLVRPDVNVERRMTLLRTEDPYAALTAAIVALHGHRRHPQWGRSQAAEIHPTATLGPRANIAPGVHIDRDVTIGADATIYPGVYIARATRIGEGCVLFPNVVVYEQCVLGDRVTIHAGTVIGEDGLGYAPVGGKWIKIPQIGNVVIGDDVEIGPNCTVDRATLGSTVIGSGTKFSNLIAIGHGTRIGEDCMFVAQVGLAGSVTVGRHVIIAGQAGAVGHISIGDDARIGAKAGVSNHVEPGVTVLGSPAVPINEARRQIAVTQQLPRLKNEIRRLRQQVDQLLLAAGQTPSTEGQAAAQATEKPADTP